MSLHGAFAASRHRPQSGASVTFVVLEQQRASANILGVITKSVADMQPVFEKILESCKELFDGDELDVLLIDDEGLLQVAAYLGKARDTILATFPAPWEATPAGRAIRERRVANYLSCPRTSSSISRFESYQAAWSSL